MRYFMFVNDMGRTTFLTHETLVKQYPEYSTLVDAQGFSNLKVTYKSGAWTQLYEMTESAWNISTKHGTEGVLRWSEHG